MNFKKNFVGLKVNLKKIKFCQKFDPDCDCESKTWCKSIQTNTGQFIEEIIQSCERKKLLLVAGYCEAVELFVGVLRTLSNIKDKAFCKNN